MNWKTWLLLFLALAAGCVASFGVKTAFFTEKNAQSDVNSDDFAPKERLLVANGPLASGTELNAQNVRLTLTSERDVPRDGIFSFDGISGRKTTRDLKDGEAISLYDLESSEENQTEDFSFVPPGCVVVPIRICSASKATGGVNYLKSTKLNNLVKPGDVVDLVVVKEDASSNSKLRLISEPVAEGVSVFSVRDENRYTSEGFTRNSILSALLSKEQVEDVRKAAEEGKIKVVFHSISDLSYEEQEEQNDFLNGDFYSSIKNNDAVLERSAVDSTRVQAFDVLNDGNQDDASNLLVQGEATSNQVSESDDSKNEKAVLMNVSRKVESEDPVNITLTEEDAPSYVIQDDLLSNSETLVGDENVEETDDVLLEGRARDKEKDEVSQLTSARRGSVGEPLSLEETNVVTAEDYEESDAKPYGTSSPKSERKDVDGTQEIKKRPRVFSPYATRETNTPRRRVPKLENDLQN